MPRYPISFDDGSMDHIPDKDWAEVGRVAHVVVQQAEDAGVWIFGGGLQRQRTGLLISPAAVAARRRSGRSCPTLGREPGSYGP